MSSTPPPNEPGKSSAGLDGLQISFLVLSVVGGFFMLRPAANDTQLAFRLTVVGIGLVGLLVVTVLKLTRKK